MKTTTYPSHKTLFERLSEWKMKNPFRAGVALGALAATATVVPTMVLIVYILLKVKGQAV